MSLRKGAFISAYACWPEIKRCLATIEDLFDISLVLYGPYEGYTGKQLPGESGIIEEYCKHMSGDVLFKMCHKMTEVQKRSQAIEWALEEHLDFLLIIDTDEYIDRRWMGKPSEFDKELNWYANNPKYMNYNLVGVNIEQNTDSWEARPRLWYMPRYVYYNNTHYYLKTANPKCPYNLEKSAAHYKTHPPQYVFKSLRIKGDPSERRPEIAAVHEHYLGLLRGSDGIGEHLPNIHYILND